MKIESGTDTDSSVFTRLAAVLISRYSTVRLSSLSRAASILRRHWSSQPCMRISLKPLSIAVAARQREAKVKPQK